MSDIAPKPERQEAIFDQVTYLMGVAYAAHFGDATGPARLGWCDSREEPITPPEPQLRTPGRLLWTQAYSPATSTS